MNQPIKLSELMARDYEETKWLVHDLIPAEGVTVISGDPGNFKTWLLLDIVRCVSGGMTLFNRFQCAKGAVLIIDEESSSAMLKERFTKIGIDVEADVFLLVKDGFKIDDSNWIDHLVKIIQEKNITLVCVDSLVRVHSKDENAASQVSGLFNAISKITKNGVSVILTHHHNKQAVGRALGSSQNLRGSSDILAAIDCHLAVQVNKELKVITIEQGKLRIEQEQKPFKVKILEEAEGVAFDFDGLQINQKEERSIKLRLEIMKLLSGLAMERKGIHANLEGDYGAKAIDDELKSMVELGVLVFKKEDRGRKVYSIKDDPAKDEQ